MMTQIKDASSSTFAAQSETRIWAARRATEAYLQFRLKPPAAATRWTAVPKADVTHSPRSEVEPTMGSPLISESRIFDRLSQAALALIAVGVIVTLVQGAQPLGVLLPIGATVLFILSLFQKKHS
ncbi:hypothetical protein QN224_13375 [Sinorhizobium sp. 8-89]|uniref:hypothetical protein n=1 Tax=Sinorhizobium sp. 7-81 TaxID=3049087 RepID=UPI0024C4238F|nr:hypothetical protein [Sinorhizobium sp. 7-81]MDK1386401.1 hypothetical protein [Sinorhizobium sp. 7-81]